MWIITTSLHPLLFFSSECSSDLRIDERKRGTSRLRGRQKTQRICQPLFILWFGSHILGMVETLAFRRRNSPKDERSIKRPHSSRTHSMRLRPLQLIADGHLVIIHCRNINTNGHRTLLENFNTFSILKG